MYWERIEAWFGALPVRQRAIEWLIQAGPTVYLVGGSVRDALLGRDAEDLDLAVDGDALRLCRRLADHIHGAYVPLDTDRDVGRVVVRVGEGQMHIDLAGLRAEGILADLAARDFTVNAMAVPLGRKAGELLDPAGGQEDLRARLLRVTSPHALEDDPLRILRGLRLHAKLRFDIEPETESLMRKYAPMLRRVSAERICDEWLQMLHLDNAAASYEHTRRLEVLDLVFPVFGQHPQAQEDAGRLLRGADDLVAAVRYGANAVGAAHSELAESLGPVWKALQAYLRHEISSGHRRATLLKLAAQFAAESLGPECAKEAGQSLRLSRSEVRFLHDAVSACWKLLERGGGGELSPLDVYRYYRRFGDAGVEGALLAWVKSASAMDRDRDQRTRLFATVVGLVRGWFEKQESWVSPEPLLTGRDLMSGLDLSSGPVVGRLMGALAEAQVQQIVCTPEEALDYLKKRLSREGDSQASD